MKISMLKKSGFICALFLIAGLYSPTVLAEPTNTFPNQSDVSPGTHVMSTLVGRTDYVSINQTYLQIYSTTPRIAIAIAGADLCETQQINGTYDEVFNAGGIGYGTSVTDFELRGYGSGSTQVNGNGYKRNSGPCSTSASNSKQYPNVGDNASNPGGLPGSTVMLVADSSKKISTKFADYYVFQFRAQWTASGGCGGTHCALNTFRVAAYKVSGGTIQSGSGSDVSMSQAGMEEGLGGYYSNIRDSAAFGIGVTASPSGTFSEYTSYFGTPCSVPAPENVYIEIYDDDNMNEAGAQDPANPFQVKLEEAPAGTSSWSNVSFGVNFPGGSGGNMNNGAAGGYREVGTPSSGNKIRLTFTSKINFKYRFLVKRLDRKNNLQFQLPYSHLPSITECPGWTLEPETEVGNELTPVGVPVPWTHWIDHIGGPNAPAGQSWSVIQTGASSGNGTKASGSTPLINTGGRYNIPGVFSYTPSNADIGRTICQELRINAYRSTGGSRTSTPPAPQCFQVIPPPPMGITDNVIITPNASPNFGGEVEADDPVSFNGSANVSNFPAISDYGYDNQSQKLAPRRVTAVASRGPVDSTTTYTSASGGPYYACSNGGSPSNGCYIPGGSYCYYSYGSPANPPCAKDQYKYTYGPSYGYTYAYWTCPSGWGGISYSGTCSRTEYRCTETGGAYSPNYPSCRTYYTCDGGVPNQGWHYSPPQCNRWYCAYSDSPPYDGTSPPTNCEYRCNGGTAPVSANPGRALLTNDHVNGTPNRNCYVRPTFNLRCQWTTTTGAVIAQNDVVVTGNGTWCSSAQSQPPGQIGETICLRYRAQPPTIWNETPEPSRQNGTYVKRWGFNFQPASQGCMRIVGKPYVRIVGGDASAGIGPGLTASTCPLSGTATINAQNRGASNGYSGSGASIAALARGTINGFASGQFANPVLGTAPKAMTFANTTGTWGGNWGATGSCVDISKFVAGATAPFPFGGGVVNGTQRYRINGNVVISNDIVYAGSNGVWTSLESIPLMQLLVVGGNIYIDRTVNQLDGTYVAVASGGIGGNIYTCSSGASQVTSTWISGCNQQLVVNGSLIADRLHLGRDCSTLNRSQANELTLYTGGVDAQQCDTLGRTRAAEVFNFVPDQWIRSSLGVPDSSYDAVTNLPPIL